MGYRRRRWPPLVRTEFRITSRIILYNKHCDIASVPYGPFQTHGVPPVSYCGEVGSTYCM